MFHINVINSGFSSILDNPLILKRGGQTYDLPIDIQTLGVLLTKHDVNLEQSFLVKIDTEGLDFDVLLGSHNLLEVAKKIFVTFEWTHVRELERLKQNHPDFLPFMFSQFNFHGISCACGHTTSFQRRNIYQQLVEFNKKGGRANIILERGHDVNFNK